MQESAQAAVDEEIHLAQGLEAVEVVGQAFQREVLAAFRQLLIQRFGGDFTGLVALVVEGENGAAFVAGGFFRVEGEIARLFLVATRVFHFTRAEDQGVGRAAQQILRQYVARGIRRSRPGS